MPLKDTPWGSMRQARTAQHTSGNVPRPPRPSYLPPTPPKCSVSPLPASNIGKSETTSVVYDHKKSSSTSNLKNGHNNITTTTTPARFAHLRPSLPALTPDGVSSSRESNNNSSTNNHDTSEESESEDLDDYEVVVMDRFKTEFGFFFRFWKARSIEYYGVKQKFIKLIFPFFLPISELILVTLS